MTGAHLTAWHQTCRAVRKARAPRRFNRMKYAMPLGERVLTYWRAANAALFEVLDDGGWERIASLAGVPAETSKVAKALTDEEKRLIAELIARSGFFEDAEAAVAAITKATALPTYEAASVFALKQIGVTAVNFELKNEAVRERILGRAATLRYSSQKHSVATLETIVRNFHDLGRNPYNDAFLKELRSTIGAQTVQDARRFALTETAIVSEMATHETWSRNGVQRKKWNATGVNTRESHLALAGVEVGMDEQFRVGGETADHPCDPNLPPDELVNCHCWLTPVVNDDFEIDPRRVWEGA